MIDFGRRAILSLRQNLISRIQEHDNTDFTINIKNWWVKLFQVKFITLEIEVIIIDDMDNEVILPKDQQIRSDFLERGHHKRCCKSAIKRNEATNCPV